VVVTSVQTPLQLIWPAAHWLGGVEVGVAQLATKSARPKQATSADKKVLRTFMFELLLTRGRQATAYRAVSYSSPRGQIPRNLGV